MSEKKAKVKNAAIIALLTASIVLASVCVQFYQKCTERDAVLEYALANTFLGLSFDFHREDLEIAQEDYASDCNSYEARYFCYRLPKKYEDEAKSIKKIVRIKGEEYRKYDITGLQMEFMILDSGAGTKELTAADFKMLSDVFDVWGQCDWETLKEDLEEENINFMVNDYGIGDCIEKTKEIISARVEAVIAEDDSKES